MNALIEKFQHTRFSGAGAAHQNGVAERVIQMVIRIDRTMLIHSDMWIPQGNITSDLWPIDIDHAVCLYNKTTLEDSGLSTYELWILSSFLLRKEIISTCHTWGDTSYIL